MAIIDSDQHLYESRTLWRDHVDPKLRDEALRIEDDATGTPRLRWRDCAVGVAELQTPGDTDAVGERHRRALTGQPPREDYDEALPADYWEPSARLDRLATLGVDEAVLFPNYGLLWERKLSSSLVALRANMGAWNRWCRTVAEEGRGRLHPVAHLTLRDPDWLDAQLAELSRAGVRLAMISPGLVDGRPLSHRDHDRIWAAFCSHGVSPVFHVADQQRPFADAWYTDEDEAFVPAIDSIFIYVGAALACTDLILNGTLERFPELRLGIVELSAVWVPMFLMMLDGGFAFTQKLNGVQTPRLPRVPSEYFHRQVRVSSFAYEQPQRIARQLGGADVLMCCSDYPHSEGTATPIADYAQVGCAPGAVTIPAGASFFSGNAEFLLRR